MASPESDVVVTAQPETSHIEIQSAPAKAAAPVVAQLKDGGAVPAYKIVKVRKPDGTIVKVKRPIHPTTPKTEAKPTAETTTTTTSPIVPAVEASLVTSPSTKSAGGPSGNETNSTVVQSSPKAAKKSSKPTEPEIVTVTTKEAVLHDVHKHDIVIPGAAFVAVNGGSRVYRNLKRLGTHGSRIASVLVPDWDLGDLEDGDEEISDDDDSDDEKYDSEDDDKSRNEEDHDDEKDSRDSHDHDGSFFNENSGGQALGYLATNGAKATSNTMNTPRSPPPAQMAPSLANGSAEPEPKGKTAAGFSINEKELLDKESAKKATSDPESGRQVVKRYSDWSRYVIWAIELLLPLLFVIIGILVVYMNGKNYNTTLSNGIQQALKVAVSIWPIIFAAVVAQSLRVYATYKVERGVRLMTLEQLVSSHSVASSIKVPFVLRRFNLVTIALLMLWALSPLASQAMQRVYTSTGDFRVTDGSSMYYVNTFDAYNVMNQTSHITGWTQYQHDLVRLYSAVFLPGDRSDGTDNFGNPLIPVFDELSTANSTPEDGFLDVDSFDSLSSLYGIPVVPVLATTIDTQTQATKSKGAKSTGQIATNPSVSYDFDIKASYITLNCSFLNATTMDVIVQSYSSLNNTLNSTTQAQQLAIFMSTYENPGRLVWASKADPGDYIDADDGTSIPTYAYSVCTFTQPLVTAHMWCDVNGPNNTACSVYGLRKEVTPPSNIPTFADPFAIASGAFTGGMTDTERYIMNPNNLIAPSFAYGLSVKDITVQQFQQRLSVLLTSFWQTGYAPTYFSTPLPENTTSEATNAADLNIAVTQSPATKYESILLWRTIWGWLAALFICCAFLLGAALFSIFWDAQTISPDVLGFASSVLRKSKYVQLPPVDSAASGAERARALGEIRVMMQDVKPKAPVGRIALGTAHPGAQRLQLGRSYR